MENIDKIQSELKKGELTQNPHLCCEYVASLCAELSFYLAEQSKIEQERAKNWLEIRKEYKSDTQATKAWEITEKGIEFEWFENRIKRIKALLTGLKTLIKMAENEQFNLQ